MRYPRILKYIYYRIYLRVNKGKCLFIPHSGFCRFDKASIINYKADNCLIFVRYLLDNRLYQGKEIVLVSTTHEKAFLEQKYCRKTYPDANITIISEEESRRFKKEWATSEYIISSEPHFPIKKKKNQQYICLSYFPISLKRDYEEYQNSYYKNKEQIDVIASTSAIDGYMESASLTLPLHKFKSIGKCRSDMLLQEEDVYYVREYLQRLCGKYSFSKVILYTPTHRDYEFASFDIKRSILGFDVDKKTFEKFLCDNQILIVCKLHPHQNAEVVNTDFPRGVVNFTGHEQFGLIELMKASDILMTDYTSAYVDYLLLDKPIIFNFYDIDKYDSLRGLAFHPFDMICAGEKFINEETFYDAVTKTISMPNKDSNERKIILEFLNTYTTGVCAKTYKTIFNCEI